ncbi:reverse transcriptase domain-containing protein [Tanacetum coccineum]
MEQVTKPQISPIPFPHRLKKEKEEAQQRKFLENLKQLQLNIPFTEALAQMPKYAKFLKSLLSNKTRLEEACTVTMNERCFAVRKLVPCKAGLQIVSSKLMDITSWLLRLSLVNFIESIVSRVVFAPSLYFIRDCKAADEDYTIQQNAQGGGYVAQVEYLFKGLGEPKPTRMSLELADRSIQYPQGIAENVLIKIDKFVLPIDFVILDMREDSKIPIILGRPFLVTARAMTDVFNKKITLRVGDEEVTFDVDQSTKKPPTEDDECYEIDDLDQTIHLETQELIEKDHTDSFLLSDLGKHINQAASKEHGEQSEPEELIRRIEIKDTTYPKSQGTHNFENMRKEHLCSTSANEIDEKMPELKDLPSHLEYAYLNGDRACPVIVSSKLTKEEKISLLQVLEKHKGAIAWKMADIKGLSPSFCTHKILLEESFKPVIQPQRCLNPKVQDVVKNEIVKLLDSGLIYPISDSPWASPVHVVPKKGGMTVVLNDNNKAVLSRTVTAWRVCIDYRKLNDTTRKDHFPLPFIDQMLERLMPFGLCNTHATFQRCMTAIFHDMVEDFMEVFMDDFSVFDNSFNHCLGNLDKMLARCEETNLVLNWENCHFMVKEGIVLGHKTSGEGIEVDRAKIDVIAKLPYPTNVKGVRSFLGHAGFYRRFIKDFSLIFKPMTQLLMKDAKFDFSDDCKKAFNDLKEKLTSAPIIISPDWNFSFELMCDASDFAVGAVLGQMIDGKFKPIYYTSKTLNDAQAHYTTTEKELLAVDAKPRLIRWVLLLQGFNIEIKDKKGAENLAADHLSRLENPNIRILTEREIADEFPDEHLMVLKITPDNDEPWYADYVNYIVGKVTPPKWTAKKGDDSSRRKEITEILAHCHSGPTRGHHSASITERKVYEAGFFWPSIF